MDNKQSVRGAENYMEQMENAEQMAKVLTPEEVRFMSWFTNASENHQLSAIEFFMGILKDTPKDSADHQQALKMVPILVKYVLFN